MKRILVCCAVVAGLLPGPALSLGIGELTLESGLNEPFEARIALLSITRDEIDSLNVGLADSEAFRRAGVDRPFVLGNLRFEVVETETGADYIRVRSHDAIREPYLNFLVELSWANGRIYREYTVLLDPPLYDAGAAPTYARAPAAPVAASPAEPEAVSAPVEAGSEYAAGPAFTGSEYGPTESADTLWSIAGRTRPDESVTVQQMMLALLRANPEAFISGNVNGLRRGHVLKIPGREEIDAVAPDQALAEIKSQYALWEDVRGSLAAVPSERPETSPAAAAPAATTSAAAPAVAEDTTELRLVAAADAGTGADQTGGADAEASALNDRLAIASEQMTSVSQENTELKDKLTESEAIIADLKRLIALKDDELAALQQQMAAGAAAPAEVPAPAAIPAEAPAAEAPVEVPADETGDEEAAAPAVVPPETGTEPPAQEPVPEEGAAAPEAAAPPAPPAEKGAASKPAPAPAEYAASLVNQGLKFVTDNLLIIGAGLGAVVLLAAVLVAVGRFRSRMEASAAAESLDEFPDFTGDQAEEELPVGSEDVTNVREQEAAAASRVAASAKEDATVFALPPEPRPKAAAKPAAVAEPAAAAAAAAATAEEVLDAFHHEVNVFMAYEDWDQAEQFVRDAIGREPNNLDFHAKLLEVFFTSGNRRKYEAAARVLNDIVGGAGPYWDNAVVMWQEMSPNRALFAAGGEEEDVPAATAAAGGGLLDLTAAASRGGDAGLDFDLGDATAEPAAKPAAAADDEPVLDITAGAEDAAAVAEPEPESADMLDVTAAVGLEPEDGGLDLEPGASEGGVLDLSGEPEPAKGDLLDLSGSGGDLLDVTAQTDVGAQIADDDLLDVTSTAASVRDSEPPEAAPDPATESVGEHTLDFNLEDLPQAAAEPAKEEEPPAGGGNIIEFESSGGSLELATDAGATEEPSLAGGLELDMGDAAGEDAADLSGLELDMGDAAGEDALDSGGLELDLTIDDVPAADEQAAADEIDMEGTVEIPKLEFADEDEDDEDDEDHTVFVPRSGDAQEQSAEDEIATKLDLAKAYLEMGDKESKESAKGILNQIMADGTEQQKRKAQELIRRIS